MQHSMRLFRAQRNFYISGFAIFLSLVIRRLIILISQQASLIANSEASMRQAQSATATAQTLMKDTKKTDGDSAGDNEKAALQETIKTLREELKREIKDKEALKSQAESLNREYDRLTGEYSKLQNQKAVGGKSD
jgi:B-cell receptor-associated protein 31